MKMEIKSELYTMEQIVAADKWQFSIPIYQRLYVWGKDQVDTLLADFANAHEDPKCDIFFLGGTLMVKREENSKIHYELIDGQQRFTTLWILSYAWQEAMAPYITFRDGEDTQTRIFFAIRERINKYLKELAHNAHEELTRDAEQETDKMRDAIARMKSFINDRTKEMSDEERTDYVRGLTEFIYGKVKLVITEVPKKTDLNKLFEVINNRGVQLKHHEILKAQMLDVLSEEERPVYACIWETCSEMDGFIEKNLSSVVGDSLKGKDIADYFDQENTKLGRESLRDGDKVINLLKNRFEISHGNTALKLSDILKHPEKYPYEASSETDDNEDTTWARSVVGFPMFLQHVLRIWLHRESQDDLPKILDRELLDLFGRHFFENIEEESSGADAVKSFIKLLWEIRYLFDRYVIKWVNLGEEEIQKVVSMRLIDSDSGAKSIIRSSSEETAVSRDLGMIQSFLYHSQEITTHYWLTPFLNYLHLSSGGMEPHITYLRHLDNCLLASELEGNLVERTKVFLNEPWAYYAAKHEYSLNQASGVQYWSYWFYKLEYVLWCSRKGEVSDRWEKFRFTAKNSVEHISPQSPTDVDTNRVHKMLDHFGNLALVSRSVNSEYSNLPYNQKRAKFRDNNAKRLDSLKMDLIYQNEHWNDDIARNHQQKMIGLMSNYFQSNTKT